MSRVRTADEEASGIRLQVYQHVQLKAVKEHAGGDYIMYLAYESLGIP